jgi:hypothetical protein
MDIAKTKNCHKNGPFIHTSTPQEASTIRNNTLCCLPNAQPCQDVIIILVLLRMPLISFYSNNNFRFPLQK